MLGINLMTIKQFGFDFQILRNTLNNTDKKGNDVQSQCGTSSHLDIDYLVAFYSYLLFFPF